MNKCSISIQVFVDFTKQLLAQDAKYKDFSEVAKFVIKRQGQPDAVKMVALKGLAKIYDQLSKKDTSYSFSEDDARIIDVDLEKDDLDNQFKKFTTLYSVKAAQTLSVDSIKVRIDKLAGLSPLDMQDEVVSIIKDVVALAKISFRKSTEDQITAIGNLFDRMITGLQKNTSLSPIVSKSLSNLITAEKKKITEPASEYVAIKTLLYGDTKRIVKKDGGVFEVIQSADGKYFDISQESMVDNTGMTEVTFNRAEGDRLDNVRLDFSPFVGGNDGTQYIFSHNELRNGMNLRDRTDEKILTNQLLSLDNPMGALEVVASRSDVVRNQRRLSLIRSEIPKRTLETQEVVAQQKALVAGNPVLTVFSPIEGAQLQFRIPGQKGAMVLYGLDNYAIVYPDNRTEQVTFSETQKAFILKSGRKTVVSDNGLSVQEPLTEEDFYNLKANYERFKDFKKAVQEVLDQNKDQEEVTLPTTLVSQYINLTKGGEAIATASTASEQSPLSKLLNKEGNPGQISFMMVTSTDEGYSSPRSVTKPVIVAKQGGVWSVVTDMKSNDYVVVERDGTTEYMNFADYVQKELKIKTEVTIDKFPTPFAWLFQKPNGTTQAISIKYAPAKQSADIAKLALSVGELIKNLNDPQAEQVKLLMEFNTRMFGFNPHHPKGNTSFAADIDTFKDPSGQRSISIQIRPSTINWSALNKDVRKALTIYIDIPVINSFVGVVRKAALSDEFKALKQDVNTEAGRKALIEFIDQDPALRKELSQAYDNLNNHVYRKFDKIGEKLAASSFNSEFDLPKIYSVMENEKSTLDGKWQMKIFDRTTGKDPGNLNNYLSLTTEEIFKYANIQPVFAAPVVASVQVASKPVQVTANQAVNTTNDSVPSSTATQIDLDFEEGAFELVMDAELFQAYQAGQFQQEVDWIKANLPKDISVEDLADIVDDLQVDGRVLGYFRDRVIYLNEQLSGRGTGYHEAFHGVFRKLMNQDTRRRYLDLALGKMGAIPKEQIAEFRQRRSLFHLSNAQVKDRMAEEYLADRFKAYKLEGRGAQEGWLKKLLNLIDSLIGFFNKNYKEVDRLFQRIDNGFYKNAEIIGEFKEGAFEMMPTRNTLVMGPNGRAIQRLNYLNKTEQSQLVNRLAELTSFSLGETFKQRYDLARKELIKELSIDNLIAQSPDQEEAIRTRYEQTLNDKLYILGVPVSFYNETGDPGLDNNLSVIQANVDSKQKYNEQQQKAASTLFKQVQDKLNKVSISNIYFDPEAILNEEEEYDEDDLGGDETKFEDSFVNINALDGLSRQFRSFFGLISYVQTDDLGVKTTRMVDGTGVFDTIMKVLSDTPLENMMPRMEQAVEKLGEDESNTAAYERLNAVWEKMKVIFGLNEDNQPTRNLNLYNQFIDTFNVADLATEVFYINTQNDTSELRVIEATIQNDITQFYEKLRRKYETGFMKKSTSQREELIREAKKTIKTEVTSVSDLGSNDFKTIKTKAKKVHAALSDIGIVLPMHTVIYSLIAIDVKENKIELKPRSKAMKQYLIDQDLINTGAYLQKDFFDKIVRYVDENTNIFDKSVSLDVSGDGTIGLSDDEKTKLRAKKRNLGLINSVLKKTGKYVVKYDLDTVVSVFRNAEGKNVYRYVRLTPPLIVSQSIRESGWEKTYNQFPVVQRYLRDNPLTANSPEMKLYLENLELRAFGGARQTLKGVENDGVTAKTIDTAGYYLSYILMSLNRKTTVSNNATITTFNRMLTQNEASNTIYMVPNLYRKMVTAEGYVVEDKQNLVIKGLMDNIQQEYNRIQREWVSRNDESKEYYNNYNAVLNADGSRNTESSNLRAYNFNMLADFFEFDQMASQSVNPTRTQMRDQLIQSAKDGVPFSKLDLKSVQSELLAYAEEKFAVHLDNLIKYNLVQESEETNELISKLIPDSYTIDGPQNSVSINSENSDLRSYLKDLYFNVFINNLQVSQFFDGDIALGVKNFADYFKRQKMNVASGPNMKSGNHTVAYVDEISVFIDQSDLEKGQYDENDEMPEGFKANAEKIKSFDGQSITTIEHRIEQYRKQGRHDEDVNSGMSVESILKASRYRKMTEEEVNYLKDNKVVLGPKKTVTGALVHYHKQAEHILFRTDSSYLVVPEEMTKLQVESRLAELYNQADLVRNRLRNADTYSITEEGDITDLNDELKDIYNQIHRYWEPLPHRSAHHYMLNSMEIGDVDQLMDLTSSKKATLLPVKISNNSLTDLTKSKLIVPNRYKFDQVETSKVSTDINSTTQLMHLIDADINLDDKEVDSLLKDAVKQYRKLTGRLSEVSLDRLNNIIKDEEGQVDVRVIIRNMRDGLEKQGADSNTLKFFEIRDDQPVHNVNLPLIKKMFTYYYFSFYSNNVFNKRQSGRKDYLITSWGYKLIEDRDTGEVIKSDEIAKDPEKYNNTSKYKLRYPGIKYDKENDRYVVEVIVPRPYFKNQEEIDLFERKLSLWLSTRIPTEDKRSMMVAKVVDFMDGAYQNAIVVPQLIHLLSGSDLDIDSLYSHTFATYRDFNDKLKVYGEANTPKEQFVEYLQSMMEDESLEPLIKAELNKVYESQITDIPESLEDLTENLNLPFFNYTKDQWLSALNSLREERNQIFADIQFIKERRKQTQEIYEKLKAENEAQVELITNNLKDKLKRKKVEVSEQEFAELLWEETAVMKSLFREQGDIRASLQTMNDKIKFNYADIVASGKRMDNSKAELDRISRLMKVIATLNVAARKKMPVTAAAYAKEVNKKGSLVTETIQNDILQAKIDILGSPYTFKKLYVAERSDVSKFEKIALAMDKTIKDVINRNNIFSPDGIIGSRDMVRSSGAGIGIAANVNKFAAFASKNKLTLKQAIWSINGKEYKDFTPDKDTRPISDIGNILGMQADAKSNPIPAVLNLNEVSLPITLVMIAQKVPLELAITINSVPLISKVVQRVIEEKRGIRTISDLFNKRSFKKIAEAEMMIAVEEIKELGLQSTVFEVTDEDNIRYTNTGKPRLRKDLELEYEFDYTPFQRVNAKDLGFTVKTSTGIILDDKAAQVYLLNKYLETNELNSDVFSVGSILNLYKKLKPSWKSVDKTIRDYEYLTGVFSDANIRFANIKEVLEASPEFKPLIQALKELSQNAETILIERMPVMDAINKTIKGGLQTWNLDDQTQDRITDLITKFFIVNKFRVETEKELQEELDKGTPNALSVQALKNALEMFKADFWKGEPDDTDVYSLEQDLDYLKEKHDSNPFVDYLKERSRQGVDLIEALSRMKLEKEFAEDVIDGYMLLEGSPDARTKLIARKLFHYLLIKDGLGYGNNTFINYLNPSNSQTFVKISGYLSDLQKQLADFNKKNRALISKGKEQSYYKKFNDLLNEFFGKKTDLNVYISSIINRIGLHAANNDIMVKSKMANFKSKKSRFAGVDPELIKAEIKFLLPETHTLQPKDIYTELEENPLNIELWLPTSKDLDAGKLVIDTAAVFSPLAQKLISQMGIRTGVLFQQEGNDESQSYVFPLFVKNNFGSVLRLVEVDGQRVSDKIIKNLTAKLQGKSYKDSVMGIRAVYSVTEQEGTNNVLNLGFDESESRELHRFSQQDTDNQYLDISLTAKFDEALQRLRNTYQVEPKRLNLLTRIIKSEVISKGAIVFEKQKNNLFYIDYTVDTKDRGPVQRKIYLRPSQTDGLSLFLEIREREIVTGNETLVKLDDNLKEFKAVDVEFVARGKAFRGPKQAKPANPVTKDMVDELVKNYKIPEGFKMKTRLTFAVFADAQWNLQKENLNLEKIQSIYNEVHLVKQGQAVQSAEPATGTTLEGFKPKPNAPSLQVYITMMRKVSDKSDADLTEMYKKIHMLPISSGKIDDVRKDKDSGECFAEL
jgi:hypothetical protein